jgi:hypothetical protein
VVIFTVLRTLIDQVQDLYLLLFVPGPAFFRADRVQWYEPPQVAA